MSFKKFSADEWGFGNEMNKLKSPGLFTVGQSHYFVRHFVKCLANPVKRGPILIGLKWATHVHTSNASLPTRKKLARIETSAICRRKFATDMLLRHSRAPTWLCQYELANNICAYQDLHLSIKAKKDPGKMDHSFCGKDTWLGSNCTC